MWPPTLTGCECERAGWCMRHQCEKIADWHLACRRVPAEFERWERGEGPCLNRLPPPVPAARLEPCVHRGLVPVEEVECELCGQRTVLVPVYACGPFGRCTERRYGNRSAASRGTASCLTCASYEPVPAVAPVGDT